MRKTPYKPTYRDRTWDINTIYLPKSHKNGFQIKVCHPEVRPYYDQFRRDMKIPVWCPLEDKERLEFEHLVLCGYYPIKLKRA